jgi:nitrogen fixation NifU-like protein
MYTPKVLKHFQHPKNYGKLKNPDGTGKVGNIVCGDVMWLYITVKNDIITNIKFETFGCVSAIATSSYVTELAKGKNLTDALAINKDEIVTGLGGLPSIKIHCSVLAVDALTEAIYDYYQKTKQPISDKLEQQHLHIVKDRDLIEDRYKDWTDKEEPMHQSS